MGYPKSHYIPSDTKSGELSVNEIRAKHEANHAAASKAAVDSWPKQSTLSPSEIEILDGIKGVRNEEKHNQLGHPRAIESGPNPRGFKSSSVQRKPLDTTGSVTKPKMGNQQ